MCKFIKCDGKLVNVGEIVLILSMLINECFFRDDASRKSENGKSLENLKIENTRLLR